MKSFLERACSLAAWFTLMAILGFAVSLLTGCGGGAGAMPFGPVTQETVTSEAPSAPVVAVDGMKTTMPVVCAADGCAK